MKPVDRRLIGKDGIGMSDLIDRQMVSYKLTDLVNEFEEILSHIRESEENDCVCALCKYDADGAYIGQSGDWCNECPGFDKADCFELNDKYKKEWLECMNTLPSVQPKLSNNSKELDNDNGELISKQEAVDVLNRGLSKTPYVNNTDVEMIRRDERIGCIQEIRELPSVWPDIDEFLRNKSPKEHREILHWIAIHYYPRGSKEVLQAISNMARPDTKPEPYRGGGVEPISYLDCSNAMLKMWMDNVVTDGEYNRIMDKLNKKREEDMRGENE